MLDPTSRFRVNTEAVGAKVLDGEAIIVNVASGRYYSLEGSGATAWELIGTGHSLVDAAHALAARYEVEPARALSDLQRLATDLLKQDLLLQDPQARPPGDFQSGSHERLEYAAPELVTFTDIEELLAIDPPMPMVGESVWELEGQAEK